MPAISDEDILARMSDKCETGMTPFELREAVLKYMSEPKKRRIRKRWDELLFFFNACELDGNGQYDCDP